MKRGLIQMIAIAVSLIVVLGLQAQSARKRGEDITKVRTLICTIVSTPGSPYRFTEARWESVCGDLLPYPGAEPR